MPQTQTATQGPDSFAALFEESLKRSDMRAGEVITAEVVRVDYNFVVVNAGLKSEAYVPIEEFKNDKGELAYQDRTKEQLDRIAALVRSAIGFDQKRGDQVEVVNLRFADAPSTAPVGEPSGFLGMLQFTKDDVMYFVELGVMMLLGLVVLFLVIRPLVKRILASDEVAAAISGVLTGPAASEEAAPAANQPLLPSGAASAIDVATIQGQVHAQSVHRVGELAERNPNETVAIIRQWLTEPAK